MNHQSNPHPQPAQGHETAPDQKPVSPRAALIGVVVIVAILGVLAAIGILQRMHSNVVLAQRTRRLAPPTVSVARPQMGAPTDDFVLPGNVTAYTDSPIYARTNGYLVHWYYDIGAHVQQGALLAVIASPEVDKQLAQAKAELSTARANANIARIQAQRYSTLVKSNAVSQESTDVYVNQAAATAAAVRSAEANVQHLQTLVSFEKIYAPFTGVITARNVDTGQLINAGAGTEMFHEQALQTLRVYTNVPQLYSNSVKLGMRIALTFPEFPGKTFWGTLVRTARAIDPISRTLLVEVDVNNRDGELMPGAMAQVHFKVPPPSTTFIIPSAALIFRTEGLRVGIVIHGDIAHLVPITIGIDNGATVQVITGLKANDLVIQDPPDSLIEGEKVTVVHPGRNYVKEGF